MKIIFPIITLLFAIQASHAAEPQKLASEAAQVSYSFGYFMGRSNTDSLKEIDLDAFSQGLKAAIQGEKSQLSDEEMIRLLSQYKRQSEAKELLELKKTAEKNSQIGEKFLAENAKNAQVKTTKSGLQYLISKNGTGQSPKKNATVKVHYEGRLIDGTVFDSSIARQQPVEFRLDQVIQGWTEGLQLMKEGAQYRFFIPANLAYGQIGSGDVIEPNSTLIFDVELIEVLK